MLIFLLNGPYPTAMSIGPNWNQICYYRTQDTDIFIYSLPTIFASRVWHPFSPEPHILPILEAKSAVEPIA